MARVLLPAQPWFQLARQGTNFRTPAGDPVTVYDLPSGGPSTPVRTLGLDAYEWIEPGPYVYDGPSGLVSVYAGRAQSALFSLGEAAVGNSPSYVLPVPGRVTRFRLTCATGPGSGNLIVKLHSTVGELGGVSVAGAGGASAATDISPGVDAAVAAGGQLWVEVEEAGDPGATGLVCQADYWS